MTAEPTGHDRLDYLSFVDFAVERTRERLPAVDPDAMRLVLTLHRLTSALVYDLESAVHRPRGLSWPGFRVLFVLWLAGPLESKRVAELSGMSRAAVSALVNTLQRGGLVEREQAEHDRRVVLLRLTTQGEDTIKNDYLAHNERERSWAAALNPAERDTLVALLEKLMAGSAAAEAKRRF
ncbi:DNA-binding MarR family transcriptional regulator [Saccharomonospora amisosensis]|uniref:DNA-binding MarR family transcriptional regulator n=1 Tax=Saccharomonospora amisosensis TaxID=1128677 RepID=A0A7X5ZQW6_9PSEU|nr:MarR family transcriptional regulator [Saccharomonospora amisosensis]NIJ12279.1 DNA-binding MarR family transcriptional regulator [Saccharomonospora amisosensis]